MRGNRYKVLKLNIERKEIEEKTTDNADAKYQGELNGITVVELLWRVLSILKNKTLKRRIYT